MEKRQLTTDEVQIVLQRLESYLNDLKTRWDSENVTETGWLFIAQKRLVRGTAFIIHCIDELIQFVEDLIPEGKDKKAAVMSVLEKLYDYVIAPAFPIFLKPFTSTIKKIVLNVIVNVTIDFFVSKYNAGLWNGEKNGTEEVK